MIYVSTIQFKADYGNPVKNRDALVKICEKAVEDNSSVLVLPELCITGYIWPDREIIYSLAEPSKGESFHIFSEFCKNNGCYMAYGFAERDTSTGLLFNSQNFINPAGDLLATYRKVHLFELDYFWAAPGKSGFMTIDTSLGRFGLGICMDLNYDGFINFHKEMNTDWLLFSTNWLEQGINVHDYWLSRFNGFKGSAFMSNTYGFEYNIEFCGQSSVYESGQFIAKGPRDIAAVLITGHDERKHRAITQTIPS